MTLADAIIYGTEADVQNLLDQKVDIDVIDAYGLTPLIETIVVNRPELTRLLLDFGANVNFADLTGRTALHWAVDFAHIDLCKLLLKHQANANAYTRAGESVLVNPTLRQQYELRRLLMNYDGRLSFAQDFINTKLIGHRYELQGEVDIVNANNQFIEIEFEGFFLEFTLGVIRDSLARYQNNFSARHLRDYFNIIKEMIHATRVAAQLITFQQHTFNLAQHTEEISKLLQAELLLIPVCYAGHAITFVKYKQRLIKIDRGENGRLEGSVLVYDIGNLDLFTQEFVIHLLYKRQQKEFIHGEIKSYLDLSPIAVIPLDPQITGNCSWANVEGAIPAMFFLLLDAQYPNLKENLAKALKFYCEWQEWDKDRALEECIDSFYHANESRRLSKVAVMAAVLFQACQYSIPSDMRRAEKILKILTQPEYLPVLNGYANIYKKADNYYAKNFKKVMDYFDIRGNL